MKAKRILISIIVSVCFIFSFPPFASACYCWDLGSSDCSSAGYWACTNAPKCCEFSTECDPNPPCPTVYYGLDTNVSSCDPNGGSNFTGIKTALGCIDVFSTPTGPIQTILNYSVRISSGIALMLFAYSGLLLITSGGDPKKFQASKEIVSAVIGGLVFIALCLVLLNFLGATVLQLGPLGFKIG